MKEFAIRITPLEGGVKKIEITMERKDGASIEALHILGSTQTALEAAFNEIRKSQSEDETCEYCHGTGEVSVDVRDSDGNWEKGVGTEKCICQIKE